jgi:preprotein translocase subunit SecD
MAAKDYIISKRILLFVAVVIVFAALDVIYGVHFGIDFAGGTQIPVTLAHSVNPDQMSSLISILQQRVSSYGLKQVTVEGVGSSQVYIIIPSVSGSEINSTINIIESQGVFEGVVNGKEALNGSGILSGSIGSIPATQSGTNVTWAVDFYITNAAENHFNKVVFGQANQPIYMFLDRPVKSIILINSSIISSAAQQTSGANEQSAVSALDKIAVLGNQTIPIEVLNPSASNWNLLYHFFSSNNGTYSTVILSSATPMYIQNNLTALGYTIKFASIQNITPQFYSTGLEGQNLFVNSWPVIGLLSAPILSPQITNGSAGLSYVISGAAPSTLPLEGKINYANNESKMIASILSGGALPVPVIVDTTTTVEPTLGNNFLYVSAIAAILAIVAVALVIVIRYRKLFLIIPILITTLAELFIVFSIIGLIGSIDLAAVAGMIAVVGTGVDAQIIITDEVLSKNNERSMKTRFGNAHYIIWTNAILLVIAMLPLLFATSLVTIVGFAESTILGALLGVIITRPTYAEILTIKYGKDDASKKS